MSKEILQKLTRQEVLSSNEANDLMLQITAGEVSDALVAGILTAYTMRPVTAQELVGFRTAIIEQAVKPEISGSGLIDVCGTGGDGKDTFNISTLVALVLAGAGKKVAKHGNYSFSSSCGSSNVLESAGVVFTNDTVALQSCIDQANVCFLHAPLFHPSLKNVAQVRKSLGIRTIFNLLGPLVNPLNPEYQLVGVANLPVFYLYKEVLNRLEKEYQLVHSFAGYDEISLTSRFITTNSQETAEFLPEELGLARLSAEALQTDQPIETFQRILNGQGSVAQNSAICANAAFAIMLSEGSGFQESYERCQESLDSGQALASLKKVIEITAA